jgi:hypothetical protein
VTLSTNFVYRVGIITIGTLGKATAVGSKVIIIWTTLCGVDAIICRIYTSLTLRAAFLTKIGNICINELSFRALKTTSI